MNVQDLHIGMLCNTKKGSGTVAWVDAESRAVHMTDVSDNHHFEVTFEDIFDDDQVHNKEDTYY